MKVDRNYYNSFYSLLQVLFEVDEWITKLLTQLHLARIDLCLSDATIVYLN